LTAAFFPSSEVYSEIAPQSSSSVTGIFSGVRSAGLRFARLLRYGAENNEKNGTAIATSQKMADSVVRYLVLNHEIPVYRIYVVGMGNAPAPTSADQQQAQGKAKHTSGGRVEISLLKNDLEQLAST